MLGPGTGMLGEDGIHVDMNHLKSGEVNLGTSIMAINFKDGVILGADSRTTTGAYIANRVTDKLTQVHDTIWCCRSGSAADTQAVADIVQYYLGMYGIMNNEPPTTQTAAALFQELCYDNKDQLSAGMIIAGYDRRHGGQVYSIPLGGSLHKQSYAIGGSGSTYIYGYCDSYWKEGMTEAEGVEFVKGALKEAIKWDGSSGGVVRMVVLTAKGAVRHLYLPDNGYTSPGADSGAWLVDMGSLVVNQVVSDIGQHPHHQHRIMVDAGSRRDEASDTSTRGSVDRRTSSASATYNTSLPATPASPSLQPRNAQDSSDRSSSTIPVAASHSSIQEPTSTHNRSDSNDYQQAFHHSQHLNQHSRGFDQSGFPLSSDPRGLSSSPSSPRLQPTYRSTRSLGGSEATSPSRIKVRDLSHIQSFASEELLTRPRPMHRSGSMYSETGRQYEISSMPVADIIEMVAGLLTKITTTNDQQHEHVHRPVPPPEEAANMSQQQSCVLAFHGKNVPSITILSYLSRIHKYCPTTYEVFLSLLVYFDRMTEIVNRGFLQNMRQQASEGPATAGGAPASHSPIPMNIDSPMVHTGQPSVNTPPSSGSIAPKDRDTHSASSLPPSPVLPPGQEDLSQFFVVDSYNIHRLVIAGVTCASKFFSDVFYTNSRYAKVGGLPLVELNHLELQFLLLNDFRLSVPVEELEAYGTMLVEFYAREIVAQQQMAQQHSRIAGGHTGDAMYMRDSATKNLKTATAP